jgi:putative alpha-1,2-mannosidase
VPLEKSDSSASLTLAYAYDDWALSRVASYLGLDEDAKLFYNRSKSYRNVFDPNTLYMCPRSSNGTFQ